MSPVGVMAVAWVSMAPGKSKEIKSRPASAGVESRNSSKTRALIAQTFIFVFMFSSFSSGALVDEFLRSCRMTNPGDFASWNGLYLFVGECSRGGHSVAADCPLQALARQGAD